MFRVYFFIVILAVQSAEAYPGGTYLSFNSSHWVMHFQFKEIRHGNVGWAAEPHFNSCITSTTVSTSLNNMTGNEACYPRFAFILTKIGGCIVV